MKTYRKELWFDLPERRAMTNITPQVERCLADVEKPAKRSRPCINPDRRVSFIRLSGGGSPLG